MIAPYDLYLEKLEWSEFLAAMMHTIYCGQGLFSAEVALVLMAQVTDWCEVIYVTNNIPFQYWGPDSVPDLLKRFWVQDQAGMFLNFQAVYLVAKFSVG